MKTSKPHIRAFWRREDGSGAVELVLVLPVLIAMTIGVIYLSMMMYAASSLHFAVEEAARCRSIKTTVCTDASSTQTYAQARYTGPALTTKTFTATQPSCGNQVVGSGTYTLRTGLRNLSVPISATACYPI